jgi:hypothetical protein
MEEARPTEGFFRCSEEEAREIFEALEIDRVAKKLIRSAAGVDTTPDGGKENDA